MPNDIPAIPPLAPRPPLTERVRAAIANLRIQQESADKAAQYHEARLKDQPRSLTIKRYLRQCRDRRDIMRELADELTAILGD